MTINNLTYAESIKSAIADEMRVDADVVCYGLGVTDPKGIFATTIGLEKEFGSERVFDMPTSENAMTGVGIGAAIMGNKVVMTHQRVDFFLLALDQLVNGAAKCHYMYGGKLNCPITIRLIIGRGWGQGPTHSQSLQAWFAHIPGLKVVMPTFADDAYTLLREAIRDPNPVIFMEHRWLHGTKELSPSKSMNAKIGKSNICRRGSDYTVIANSYLTIEALHAARYLDEKYGINVEIIDLITIKPIDYITIFKSVRKTQGICVVDSGFEICGIASEIISKVVENAEIELTSKPIKIAMRDCPEPTSYELTKGFYIRAKDIAYRILNVSGHDQEQAYRDIPEPTPHDVPGKWFTGPF